MSDGLNAELVGTDEVKQKVNEALPALRKLLVEKGYLTDPNAPLPKTLEALANASQQNFVYGAGINTGTQAIYALATYKEGKGIDAQGMLNAIDGINSVKPDEIVPAVNVKDSTFLIKQITNGKEVLNVQDLQNYISSQPGMQYKEKAAQAIMEIYGKDGVLDAQGLTNFLNDSGTNNSPSSSAEIKRTSSGNLVFFGDLRQEIYGAIQDNRASIQGMNATLQTENTEVVGAPLGVLNAPSSKTPQL